MPYVEIIISLILGLLLTVLTGWVFSLKTKGLLRLLFNSTAGCILLFALSLFKIVYIPLNPMNALLAGFLGVPGVGLAAVLSIFL